MSNISKNRFLVVGTVRNCQRTIEAEIHHLTKVLSDSLKVSWLIVESDSSDRTVDILKQLKQKIPNFDYCSKGKLQHMYPERTSRIAACRDHYVNAIRTDKNYLDIDYVIVADLDGMCGDLTTSSLETCWAQNNWTACFANQPKGYYDIWALRHPYWSPKDPFETYKNLHSMGIKAAKAYRMAIIDKIAKIAPHRDWINVDSAFGGLGIYKKEVFSYADYSISGFYPPNTCEHTSFNRKIVNNGSLIFINPALINIYHSKHTNWLKIKYYLLKIFGHNFFDWLQSLKK